MSVTRITPDRKTTTGGVTKDTSLGDASVTLSNSSGTSAQEFYHVVGLKGSTAVQRLHAAALAPSIPRQGSLNRLLGVPVESVRARFVGEGLWENALVEVSYGLVQGGGGFDNDPDDPNAAPQIEIISTKQPVTTQFDSGGKLLSIIGYQQFPRDADGEIVAGPPEVKPPQRGTVEVIQDMTTIVARRRERLSPGVGVTRTHNNAINSDRVFGDPKHIWHVNISGTTDDGGATWNVVYEFQRNSPLTWNAVILWTDPETGFPGADVELPPNPTDPGSNANGSIVVRLYRNLAFRELQLPIFD